MAPMVCFLLFLAIVPSIQGEIRLPNILGNYMVLQQQSNVLLWGWANPAEKVQVETGWDTSTKETTADSGGKWKTTVKNPTEAQDTSAYSGLAIYPCETCITAIS